MRISDWSSDVGSSDLLVAGELVGRGAGDVQGLAAQRQHGLGLAVARLLGRAARRIALDEEDLGTGGGAARAVGELARQAQLAGRRLAGEVLRTALALALLRPFQHALHEQIGRAPCRALVCRYV